MGIKDKFAEKLAEKFMNGEYSDEEKNETVSQAKEIARMIMADELAEYDREIEVFNAIAENAYANENCFRLHIERNQKGTPFFKECDCDTCSHVLGCRLGEESEWQEDLKRCTLTETE